MRHGYSSGGHSHHGRRFARDEHEGEHHRHGGGHHGGPRGEQRGEQRGERRGGRGLGRFFAHGDLRLVILGLIAEKPRHGYEIIKAIEEQVAGAYSPSPGVIYPTLTLLEELGQVTVTEQDGKKLHAITDQGRAFLEANRPAVEALSARMREAGRGPSPQIRQAMETLRHALRLRLSRGPLSEDQANAIAAALDSAAAAVERV